MEDKLQISLDKQQKIFKWLVNNASSEVLFIIFSEKRNQYFKYKNKFNDNIEIDIIAFVKALELIYDEQQILTQKNKSMKLHSVKRAAKIYNLKYKKNINKEKWDFLLNHRQVILFMKNDENLSTRQISEQLKKRKYIKNNTFKNTNEQSISHMYIQKFLNFIEINND